MQLPFLSEALIHNLNLLSKKLQVLWLGAVLGLFWGPLGAALGGVQGPSSYDSLNHAASLPFRGFDEKNLNVLSKKLWVSQLTAVLGCLRLFLVP